MRLLFGGGLRGARRNERETLVARPAERAQAGDRRANPRAGARIDDLEVLDLRTLCVDADGELRRIAVRHGVAELGLARRIERDRIEQQNLAAVDTRVQPCLRLSLLRALEEFAPVLEKRRVGLIAIEVARELVLETRDRRPR